eukprot:14047199-Alexandrium_andersonii.AAC.1
MLLPPLLQLLPMLEPPAPPHWSQRPRGWGQAARQEWGSALLTTLPFALGRKATERGSAEPRSATM